MQKSLTRHSTELQKSVPSRGQPRVNSSRKDSDRGGPKQRRINNEATWNKTHKLGGGTPCYECTKSVQRYCTYDRKKRKLLNVRTDFMHSLNLVVKKKQTRQINLKSVSAFILKAGGQLLHTSYI